MQRLSDETAPPAGAARGIVAACQSYDVAGRRMDAASPEFADAVASAHALHARLRCLCRSEGVDMYVARLPGETGGYGIKRMPDTGRLHAVDCPSYAPAATLSGLGPLLGRAIAEDPVTGETTLKLDFSLVRMAGRAAPASAADASGSVSSPGARLSLRGLLHFLWDEAELARWQPRFADRRNWGLVRRHLLTACERKNTGREPLRLRLYVPEPFVVEERDAISSRRTAEWSRAMGSSAGPRPLMLLIAEAKEIAPARYGFKMVVKHLPDSVFSMDEALYRRLERRFEAELALWVANDDLHLVVIATFGVNAAGVAALEEVCLMPVSRHWLPVDDAFGKQLADRLVADGRAFTRTLRYNASTTATLPFGVLSDCGPEPVVLRMLRPDDPAADDPASGDASPTWSWRPSVEPMPALPVKGSGMKDNFTFLVAPSSPCGASDREVDAVVNVHDERSNT